MVVVNGRIVDFLIDRCEDGYAEFLFKSDYDKDCPRFEAICSVRFLMWCLACR